MLPIPDTTVWSSSARLSSVRRRRIAATAASRENAGSIGSRAMCAIGAGSSVAARSRDEAGARDSPPKVRWSTNRSSGPPSSKRDPDPQVLLVGPARGGDEHLAAHPEVREHGVAPRRTAFELEPQVLAAPPRRGDRAPGQAGREVGATLEVPAHRARDAPPRRAAIVRPTTWSARPRRTTSTSGSSGTGRQVSSAVAPLPDAASAVRVRQAARRGLLLGLLLGAPVARAQRTAADHRRGGEQLGVVRPLLGDPVLGHAQVRRRRQLLQAGLPVQAGTEQRRRLRAARRTAGAPPSRAVSRPCSQVHRADQRLDGVGEDARSCPATGQLLAAPELAGARPSPPGRAARRRRRARAC